MRISSMRNTNAKGEFLVEAQNEIVQAIEDDVDYGVGTRRLLQARGGALSLVLENRAISERLPVRVRDNEAGLKPSTQRLPSVLNVGVSISCKRE